MFQGMGVKKQWQEARAGWVGGMDVERVGCWEKLICFSVGGVTGIFLGGVGVSENGCDVWVWFKLIFFLKVFFWRG